MTSITRPGRPSARAVGAWSVLLALANAATVWRALFLLRGGAPSAAPSAEVVPQRAVELAVRLTNLLGAPATMLALALVALVTLAVEASWGRDGGGALLGAGMQRVVRAVQWAAAGPMLVVAVLATLAVLAYVVMGLVVLALAAGPFLLVLLPLTRWAPGPPGAGRPRRSR